MYRGEGMEQPLISSISRLVTAPVACDATNREEDAVASAQSAMPASAVMRSVYKLLPGRFVSAAQESIAAPVAQRKTSSTLILKNASSLSRDPEWQAPAPDSNCSLPDSSTVAAACCASRDTLRCDGSHISSSRFPSRSSPPVQTTSASATTLNPSTFLVTPLQQAGRISWDVAADTYRTSENFSAACLCQDEEACRSRRASYRCIELSPSSSSSDSSSGTTANRLPRSERHSLPVIGAELVSGDGSGGVRGASLVNVAAAPLSAPGSPSNNRDASTGFAGAPLSDELAAEALTARERRDSCAASSAAALVDTITAAGACRSTVSSSSLPHSQNCQLVDDGEGDLLCRRANLEGDRGRPDAAEGVRLLQLLHRASSSREGLDAVSTGEVARLWPDMENFAGVEESKSFSLAPDAPLIDVLSAIDSPKVGDLSRDVVAEGADAGDLDAGEHTQMPVLRALSLRNGLVGGAAAPRTRHSELWRPAVVTGRSRSTTATALASSRSKVQNINSDDGDVPTLVLHDVVTTRLSPRSLRLRGRSDSNNGAPAASACSTPLLPLSGSRSSGSGVLFSKQLSAEPSGLTLTTSTDVVAAALPAAVSAGGPATARSWSTTSDTPLLDFFHVALSPCPSSVAPKFLLVPCPATSRVSTSARGVQQRWRDQVRARTGAGVGGRGVTSPPTEAAYSLDPPGGRTSRSQQPPYSAHAEGNSRNGSASRGGAWDAVRAAPLQDWVPPLLRWSSGGDDAPLDVAPLSLTASSLRTTVNLSEVVLGDRPGHVSSPQHHVTGGYAGHDFGCAAAATLSLRAAIPRPSSASVAATPPPLLQLQDLPGTAHHSPAVADSATQSISRASHAGPASSSPLPLRHPEQHPLLCPKHCQRDGTGSRGASPCLSGALSAPEPRTTTLAPPAALDRSGGSVGVDTSGAAVLTRRCGGTCTSPLLTTAAEASVHGASFSALFRAAHGPASNTPAGSASGTRFAQAAGEDAGGPTLWSPAPLATAHCHESGLHASPATSSVYSCSARRLHARPSFSASPPHRRLLPSAMADSFTSPSAWADSRPRVRLCQSTQSESLCVPADGAPVRRLSPLTAEFCADAAGRWVSDVVLKTADTSLAGAAGQGLASMCSTPPPPPPPACSTPRPSFLLIPQRAPAHPSLCRGEDACLRNAVPASAQRMVKTSACVSHGSAFAGAATASAAPLWAPSLCTLPVAVATVGGSGSNGAAEITSSRGRRPHCSTAYEAIRVDGDVLVHFGVESELCGLQRAPHVFSPPSSDLSSAFPASAEATARACQQPAPSTLHVVSQSGRAGSNGVGSSCAYASSGLLLVPPPSLVALSANRFSSSLTFPLSDATAPPMAATGTAAARATASVHYSSSLGDPSPLPCACEPSASLAATMTTWVEEGDAQDGVSAALDAPNGTTPAAAEGASSLLPVSLPAASPATRFQCAFSSLRGCRNRQEDSVMIVAELPVCIRSNTHAAPTGASAYAAPTWSGDCSCASALHGGDATCGDGGPAEKTDSVATEALAAAAAHLVARGPGGVVFSCFGVFDGHCGDAVASLASHLFPEHFEYALQAHQSQGAQYQQEGRGVSCGADEPAEGPVAEQQRRHHETAAGEAAEFQQVVSAALVQALVHLDLTLYDVLHGAKQGPSAQCRDSGSTATVAALFKSPTGAASCHNDVRAVVGSCMKSTLRSASGDGGVPRSSGDSAATRTSAPSDKPWGQEERGKAVVPLTRLTRTEDTYRLCIANLGDSRAIIGNLQTGELLLSTADHRVAAYPSEAARILAAGGVVEFGRVDGTLDVTRGLGDYRFKVAPTQWWASAPAASAASASASVSQASLAASWGATTAPTSAAPTEIGRSSSATAITTTSPARVKGVADSVPPASNPRLSGASGGSSVARVLRWQSSSGTLVRSPVSASGHDGGAAADSFHSFRHLQWAANEAQPAVAPPSQSPPSGAGESWGGADTGGAQQPPSAPTPIPPSPISSPSPLSPCSPLASASAVTPTGNAVSNIADVYEWEVGRGEVLILASDGVWDRMASEDVLAFVCQELATAQQQSEAAAAKMASSDDTPAGPACGVAMETRKSLFYDGADAEVSAATEGSLLSLGEALECHPQRHPSPCREQKSISARHDPAALLCTPGGNGAATCGQDEDAACSLADPTGGSPRFFAVQAAARRLTEHVVDSLSSGDNTTVVIVVFD